MGLIKEPKSVDFSTHSEPWTEEELKEFRILMDKLKSKKDKAKILPSLLKEKINVE
jgi:hypothetical protein